MRRERSRVLWRRFAAIIGVDQESGGMNAAQLAAFRAASGVTASTLLLAIASMVLLLAFVWVMWVTLGTFRAWQDGKASLFDLTWSALRASIILMVLGFYLR